MRKGLGYNQQSNCLGMKSGFSRDFWAMLVIRILIALFLAIFLLNSLAAVSGNSYGWDIDHEMYFGTRLLEGELVYTKEFHDKLPLVQYLFALPALLKSVRVWALGSIGLSIIAAFAMRNSLVIMINSDPGNLSYRLKNLIANCGASCYLFLIATLPATVPESMSLINPIAASLGVLSIYFLLRSSLVNTNVSSFQLSLMAAVLGASAISIRPYLAPAVVLLGIWIPLRTASASISPNQGEYGIIALSKPKSIWFISIAKYLCVWIIMLLISGALLNAPPYMSADGLVHFVDGVRHNAQSLNPQSFNGVIGAQAVDIARLGGLVTVVTAFSVITPIAILAKRLSRAVRGWASDCQVFTSDIDFIFIGLVPFALIEVAILSRHYWDHYQQFFAPYIAFSFAFSIHRLVGRKLAYIRPFDPVWFFIFVLALFIMAISKLEIGTALVSAARINRPHPQESVLADIKNVTLARKRLGKSAEFLDISHMYSHWMLGESRHGFPHAANIVHIGRGWWEKLDRSKSIDFPYNRNQLCEKLQSNGPSIIFVSGDSPVDQCLISKSSVYKKLDSPVVSTPGLKVFARD
jgi:hypothetical protein